MTSVLLWASSKDRDWDERVISTLPICGSRKSTAKGIAFSRVPGSENCADLFTKPLTRESLEHFSELIRMDFLQGHDDIAFTINFIGQPGHSISSSLEAPLQDIGQSGTLFGRVCCLSPRPRGPRWASKNADVDVVRDGPADVYMVSHHPSFICHYFIEFLKKDLTERGSSFLPVKLASRLFFLRACRGRMIASLCATNFVFVC